MGQYQQVIRNNRAPNILLETDPSGPITTGKPKRTFQPGYIRLDPRPKVSQLLINPMAFDHLQDRKPFLLGKGYVFSPLLLCPLQVFLRGKTSIGSYLKRGR